eukprot:4621705-Alexandrium_andersonii.AAC.1
MAPGAGHRRRCPTLWLFRGPRPSPSVGRRPARASLLFSAFFGGGLSQPETAERSGRRPWACSTSLRALSASCEKCRKRPA